MSDSFLLKCSIRKQVEKNIFLFAAWIRSSQMSDLHRRYPANQAVTTPPLPHCAVISGGNSKNHPPAAGFLSAVVPFRT